MRRSPSKRATVACGSRQACCCVPVRNVPSTSNGFCAFRAASSQFRAFFVLCENAADGPRTLPFQGAGEPAPSETLPAFFLAGFFKHHRRIRLARRVQSEHRWQAFADDPDGRDGRNRGLSIRRRHGRDGVADIADNAVVAEQGDGRDHAGDRARRRKVELNDPRMREVRAEDDAFQLSVMTDIDGKFCKPGHFLPRLEARRDEVVAVEAARARLGHGAENAVIGAAAAQMPRQAPRRFPRATVSPLPPLPASGRETPPPRR